MRSNHVNFVSIFLDTLFVFCLVLASLPNAESESSNRNTCSLDTSLHKNMSVRTGELSRNHKLSSPEECARTCYAGEPPRTCYYHWTLEIYNVLGQACELCTPNNANSLQENCQCVTADGIERSILTVNRMLPGPSIEVCKGDKVVIDVQNNLEGMEVTIHWHGLFQNGYQYYDGVPFVTQCPISQYTTFRYQWVADNAGTHFWHSHTGLQKMDGLYGSLIVREPICKEPNRNLYDEDLPSHVMVISDWMHEHATERLPGKMVIKPTQRPESALINGKGQYTNRKNGSTTNTPLQVFTIKAGRRYRFRMINAFCSVCPGQLNIQNHALTLIATDGEAVHPVHVNSIVSFAGERYDFVINADQPPCDYWIQLRGLGECGINRVQQLAILRYEGGPHKPRSRPPTYDRGLPKGVVLNPLDAICDHPREDAICINQLKHVSDIDEGILRTHPDMRIFLPFSFLTYEPEELFQPKTYDHFLVGGGTNLVSMYIDGISFEFPSSPLLSQIKDIPPENICNKDKKPANCGQNCTCTHRIDIPLNACIEVVLIDEVGVANLSHPFHLHGYAFNVVGIGRSPDKNVTKISLKHVRDLDKRGLLRRNMDMLPFKDTIAVPNNGYVILRFCADNPGDWLIHCHFIYHIPIGMDAILHVGTPKDLPPIPPGFPTCGNYLPPITPVDGDSHYSSCIKSHGAERPGHISKM